MIHQCGDSDLDPGQCPACVGGDRMPSSSAIRQADRMMAKRDRGECDECPRLADGEDSLCRWCRGENAERS